MAAQRPPWLSIVEVDHARAVFTSQLSLRNACVVFYEDRHSMHRAHVVVNGPLESPIIMHGFSEYVLGYLRLLTVRPAGSHERRALNACWRSPLGLGVPVSHPSSLYHQLFHAVPAWHALRAVVKEAGYGSDAPAASFLPLTFTSAALGYGKPAAPRRWHAWELSLRALTRATPEGIAAATAQLLRVPCTCFDRLEASATPFNPGSRAAARQVYAFRDAALRNLPRPLSTSSPAGSPPKDDVLLISRLGERRAISNEAALWAQLRSGVGPERLRRIHLESLPLSSQMRLAASASVIVAVHGQALAWLAFLPSDQRQTAVVEVAIISRRQAINGCYEAWSKALGVKYYRVAGRLTGGCNGGSTARDNEAQATRKLLNCNVTVDVTQVVSAAINAAAPRGGARLS